MDISEYRRVADPKIQAGKMVGLVLATKKQKEREKFLRKEEAKENLEPLLEKLDEIKEKFDEIYRRSSEISTVADQPDISTLDFDRGFSEEEKNILLKEGLDLPSKIFKEGNELQSLHDITKLNNMLGKQKRATGRRESSDLQKYSKTNRKLRDRIKSILELKEESPGIKKGRGLGVQSSLQAPAGLASPAAFAAAGLTSLAPIFVSPEDLLGRFELLGGSTLAGNNKNIEEEFVAIAHKLRDLGILNNRQLLKILERTS